MRAPKMTRKRALELAQECIEYAMHVEYDRWQDYRLYTSSGSATSTKRYYPNAEANYAELAAALAMIEHMARQKEMTL